MRKTFFFIIISFLSTAIVFAQPKGYKPVSNISAFQQTLAQNTSSIKTLQSDFVQTKHLTLLSDKITSKGIFYYQKEDKVRIEYTTPFSYLLVMNAGQIMVKDEQKTNRVNTRNSKTLQSVNRIMIDCMRGTVFNNKDFKATAFESGNRYMLLLVPATNEMKKMFKDIAVYLSKTNFDVEQLTMTEQGGDYTDMDFGKTQRNISLNNDLFKIR